MFTEVLLDYVTFKHSLRNNLTCQILPQLSTEDINNNTWIKCNLSFKRPVWTLYMLSWVFLKLFLTWNSYESKRYCYYGNAPMKRKQNYTEPVLSITSTGVKVKCCINNSFTILLWQLLSNVIIKLGDCSKLGNIYSQQQCSWFCS